MMKRRRVESGNPSPTPDTNHLDCNNVTFLSNPLKFYKLKIGVYQSLADYLKHLNTLSAGITSQKWWTDMIIRCKLIQEIDDEDVLAELSDPEMRNASGNDILEVCDRLKKDRLVWSEVIPYLTLPEVIAVHQTSVRMKGIIRWCLKGDTSLYVHGDLLDDYELIFQAMHLHLNAIPKSKWRCLLKWVYRIKSLTICNTSIDKPPEPLPMISKLSLINVTIDNDLLNQWLSSISDLKYLNLENVTTSHFGPLVLKSYYSVAHSIKIKCPRVHFHKMNWPANLHIVAQEFRYKLDRYKHECPEYYCEDCECGLSAMENVKELTLEVPRLDFGKYTFPKLERLTIKSWPSSLRLPRNLAYLRIIDAVDSRLKDDILKLSVKTVEVTYYDFVTEGQENLMIRMLNSDSLLHISNMLSNQKDRLSFANTHPIIGDVVFRHGLNNMEINPHSALIVAPAFPYLRELLITTPSISHVIPLCTSITGLRFGKLNLSVPLLSRLPTRLSKLCLTRTSITESSDDLVQAALSRYLDQLEGICEFAVADGMINQSLTGCLLRNSETLTTIGLEIRTSLERKDFWDILASLPRLTELRLKILNNYNGWPLKNSIERMGGQLLKLTVDCDLTLANAYAEYFSKQYLPRLQELTICGKLTKRETLIWVCTMPHIGSIDTLRKVDIPWVKKRERIAKYLVRKLPLLEEINIGPFNASLDFGEQLIALRESKGRHVRFLQC